MSFTVARRLCLAQHESLGINYKDYHLVQKAILDLRIILKLNIEHSGDLTRSTGRYARQGLSPFMRRLHACAYHRFLQTRMKLRWAQRQAMVANPEPVITPTAYDGLTAAEHQFLTSFDNFGRYPRNLLVKNQPEATLLKHATALSRKSNIWFSPEAEVIITVCELDFTNNRKFKANVISRTRLTVLG